MEKKKLIELVGSIFVAVIFLTSYAAFGSNSNGSNTATTTAPQQQTIFAKAYGTVNITSYGSELNVNISCSNVTNVSARLNSELADMEKNGSVSNFYAQQASQILVQAGNLSSYKIFQILSQKINESKACTGFGASANIQLPSSMSFHISGQKSGYIITIPSDQRSYALQIMLTQNAIRRINVSVSGLLSVNGSVSGSLVVQQV